MATIFRDLSYRYQWLYDFISSLATLTVGGEHRFRQLPLQGLNIGPQTRILDLCCGSGQSTKFLVQLSEQVTGLDASAPALARAKENVPRGEYVEGWAEDLPFVENYFDLVHTSAALHEMAQGQLRQILQEVHRVLKPGGVFTLVDFHPPQNPIFWPGVALFLGLFETETAWELLGTDLLGLLGEVGFEVPGEQRLYAGGSLQVIQVIKQ